MSNPQGWHTGGNALYGYRFVTHEHPNPHKAARGQAKRTLELDPVRAPVVRHIYELYLTGGFGLKHIAEMLNREPDRWPPPIPANPSRARTCWGHSSVWEVLHNPKYTGYQVWNRRARKKGHNRMNPPDTWVWSDEPCHPALVSREEFESVQARASANEASRRTVPATEVRPTARNDYLYRGILRCGICGLKMWGNRRNVTYYSCRPAAHHTHNIPEDHPKYVYLNEAVLSEALFKFLRAAIFGPERHAYWERCLDHADGPVPEAPATERLKELTAEVADLQRRLERQLINLEADDVTPNIRQHINRRVNELENTITEHNRRRAALASQASTEEPTMADLAPMLRRLPILADRLADLPPSDLRALFESLQLDIAYHPAEGALDVSLTLYDDGGFESSEGNASEDCSVPPVGFEPTLKGF